MRSILLLTMIVVASAFASPVAASIDAALLSARADQAAPSVTTESPGVQASGVPAQSAPARSMRAYWHVFIAFGITWALIFGFALSIGRRFGSLEEEIQRLSGSR